MRNLKTQKSDSYHEYLIESLKEPEEAAGYIEVVLEEGKNEPFLLRKVLINVAEAYASKNHFSESAKQQHQKLEQILLESDGIEIYTLLSFLDELGFRLAVTPK